MAVNQISEEFSSFIEALRSPDNAVRDAAEARLDDMRKNDLFNVITQFFNALESNISTSQKAFIAVILRKVIDKSAWDKLDGVSKPQIHSFLLQLFQNEPESRVRRAVCDIIIQITEFDEEWPNLYEFIIAASSQPNDVCIEGLYLLKEVGSEDESMVATHITEIVQLLSNILQSQVLHYRVSAASCVMKLLSTEVDNIVTTFVPALPAVVETIQATAMNNDVDNLMSLLQDLDSCLEVACSFLTSHLPTLVETCLTICANANFADARALAADVICVIAQNNGGFFRKNPRYVENYLNVAVEMMQDIDDDENWVNGMFGEEEELAANGTTSHVLGCVMVNNMATHLHAAVYKPLTQLISKCSRSDNWKVRRCVFTIMSFMAEGCRKQMETDLKLHTNNLVAGLNDPHPRVVYVAAQTMAYLSVALPGTFQKKVGVQVLQACMQLIQKQPCLLVQAILASSIGQFCDCEKITKKIFKNMLAPLVEWLTNLCSAPMPPVQAEAISTIGLVCRATKDDFAPFFHTIVQGLISVLSGPVTPENISVHSNASMCLSSLVSSMGKAASQNEAWEIMQFMLGLIEKTAVGDERLTCLLDCACEVFQYCTNEQKQQFLSIMIPYLLNMAKTDVGISIRQVVSGPEFQAENGIETSTFEARGMGKVQVSVNTTAIECVATAVRLIHNLIIDAQELITPYVESIHAMVFSLNTFDLHEEVRVLCAKIMPQLLELMVASVKEGLSGSDSVNDYFTQVMTSLFQMYGEEDNATERLSIAEAIRDSIMCIYNSGDEQHHMYVNQRVMPSADTLTSVIELLTSSITESMELLEATYKAIDFNDRDQEDARNEFEETVGEEKQCVENLIDAVSFVIRLLGPQAMPLFEKYLKSMCLKYMQSAFEYIKFAGTCIMDDMMQFAPSCMGDFVMDMMNFFSQNVQCEDPSLRQCVLYGIKIVVEKFPEMIASQTRQVLASLMSVINLPDAMEDDYHSATDNAVSAVFSILLSFGNNLSPKERNDGINLILQYLPMSEDIEEAQNVHARFIEELMKPNHGMLSNPNFLNTSMQLLPLLLLPSYDEGDNEYEVVYPETKQTIVNILKQMSPNELNRLLQREDPEVKAFIMHQLQ